MGITAEGLAIRHAPPRPRPPMVAFRQPGRAGWRLDLPEANRRAGAARTSPVAEGSLSHVTTCVVTVSSLDISAATKVNEPVGTSPPNVVGGPLRCF